MLGKLNYGVVLIALIFALSSSGLTTLLAQKVTIVLSSVIVTLFLCGISMIFYPNMSDLQPIIYGSSFVGMTSQVILRRRHIIMGSILYLVVFTQIDKLGLNLGGTQGFSAFISISILILIFKKR